MSAAARPADDPADDPRPGPRLARLPAGGTATKRLAAVRRLHGARRRAAWRQRLVEAERGLVLGFRRDGVLCGHLFVVTLAAAAGLTFGLGPLEWAAVILALSSAIAAELFGQVLAALAAAVARGGEGEEGASDLAAAVRLGSGAAAIAALGACGVLVAVFAPAVTAALG